MRAPGLARLAFVGTLAMVAALGACRAEEFSDPPIAPIRDMHNQDRFDPQAHTEFFADKRTMRSPVSGTLSRQQARAQLDEEAYTGVRMDRTGYVERVPASVVRPFGDMKQMMAHGRERYAIYCVPCHDAEGTGQGTVTKVPGFAKLPNLHDARFRAMPDGQIYATIKNGVRTMPAYAPQIPIADRWAIVAYVRALQVARMEGKP